MPHIILEYSRNLEPHIDIEELCIDLHETLADAGVDKSRIKTRAIALAGAVVGEDGPTRVALLDEEFPFGLGLAGSEQLQWLVVTIAAPGHVLQRDIAESLGDRRIEEDIAARQRLAQIHKAAFVGHRKKGPLDAHIAHVQIIPFS